MRRIAPGGPRSLPTRVAPSLVRALRDARGSPCVDSGDDRYPTLVRVVIGRSSRVAVPRSLTVSHPRPENRCASYYPILKRKQKFGWWRLSPARGRPIRFLERFRVAPTIDLRAALDGRFSANLDGSTLPDKGLLRGTSTRSRGRG